MTITNALLQLGFELMLIAVFLRERHLRLAATTKALHETNETTVKYLEMIRARRTA